MSIFIHVLFILVFKNIVHLILCGGLKTRVLYFLGLETDNI